MIAAISGSLRNKLQPLTCFMWLSGLRVPPWSLKLGLLLSLMSESPLKSTLLKKKAKPSALL